MTPLRLPIAAALSVLLLSSCVVPLKVPPITPGTEVAPEINWKRLAEFAEAAGNAYATVEEIEKTYGKKNVVVRDLPGSEGRYFIYFNHKEKTQTLAVRGTANKANALVDLDSIKVFDPRLNIFIHRGFLKSADALYADALPLLQPDYKTRLTGHSLGGAMACLLMMTLIHEGYPVEEVLTFGQPKVTNEQGGREFSKAPLYRIVNDNDIVAQVPPSNVIYDLAGTFEHFCPEITLLGDNKWSYSPVHIPQDYVTNNNWKTLTAAHGTDHQIKNYIERIKGLR